MCACVRAAAVTATLYGASQNPVSCPPGRIHEYHAQGAALVDGYAPFCKHVFVPNFVGAKTGAMPVSFCPAVDARFDATV